jgi:hypothetical protein
LGMLNQFKGFFHALFSKEARLNGAWFLFFFILIKLPSTFCILFMNKLLGNLRFYHLMN